MLDNPRILFTGGEGKLASEINKLNSRRDKKLNIVFASSHSCNLYDRLSVQNYAQEKQYFDIVIGGAYNYPGTVQHFTSLPFILPINHIFLLETLNPRPYYFINFTTSTENLTDDSPIYRAHKKYIVDVYRRYFSMEENKRTKFFNIHPHHIADLDIRRVTSTVILDFLANIQEYKEEYYSIDIANVKMQTYVM